MLDMALGETKFGQVKPNSLDYANTLDYFYKKME